MNSLVIYYQYYLEWIQKERSGSIRTSNDQICHKGSNSRYPRQELSPEEAQWFDGLKRGLERRKTEETCPAVFLVEAYFKAFSAISSARRIFFPSSLFSTSSCCEYSSTVFQPNSDLTAIEINFSLVESLNII